jgi:hypothetical protein
VRLELRAIPGSWLVDASNAGEVQCTEDSDPIRLPQLALRFPALSSLGSVAVGAAAACMLPEIVGTRARSHKLRTTRQQAGHNGSALHSSGGRWTGTGRADDSNAAGHHDHAERSLHDARHHQDATALKLGSLAARLACVAPLLVLDAAASGARLTAVELGVCGDMPCRLSQPGGTGGEPGLLNSGAAQLGCVLALLPRLPLLQSVKVGVGLHVWLWLGSLHACLELWHWI